MWTLRPVPSFVLEKPEDGKRHMEVESTTPASIWLWNIQKDSSVVPGADAKLRQTTQRAVGQWELQSSRHDVGGIDHCQITGRTSQYSVIGLFSDRKGSMKLDHIHIPPVYKSPPLRSQHPLTDPEHTRHWWLYGLLQKKASASPISLPSSQAEGR